MTARRLAAWCLAPACLAAALLPAPAVAQKKGDSDTIKLRIYGSLLPGVGKADAKGFTQPMCDFLGDKVGQRMECDVYEGTSADDMLDFGKKLNGGDYHLGAVWGVEYGWLREKFPNLKALVVISSGQKAAPTHTTIFVAKARPIDKLADLKGKRLAVYKDMPLMDRLFLREMLQEEKLDPKMFLARNEPLGSVKLAAAAVRNGNADCVVMNNTTYARLKDLQPGLADALVALKSGETYPMPVLIGSPEVVDQLRKRKGLWADLREQFLDVHNSPEGKECVNFWRFQTFVPPDKDFEKAVDDMARKLPVKVLLNLE